MTTPQIVGVIGGIVVVLILIGIFTFMCGIVNWLVHMAPVM